MQDDVKRRAGPYQGNGTTTDYPFGFYVFSDKDVRVEVSDEGSVAVTVLEKDVDYSVMVNADQDATPGGAIQLLNPLSLGKSLAIISNVAYTQEMQLTNFSRFPPEILNAALDRTVVLIQQLKEQIERTITVPSTSSKTPEQLLAEILEVASSANDYAIEAKAILDKVIPIDARVTANADSVAMMKASVDESEQNVTNIASQVNEYSDELILVSENLGAIETVGTQRTAIQAIANDLQGFPVYEFDGGEITEPNESMVGVGGVLRICAENIEDIRKVAASLDNTSMLTNLAEVVDEIGSTDYVQIDETGQTGA